MTRRHRTVFKTRSEEKKNIQRLSVILMREQGKMYAKNFLKKILKIVSMTQTEPIAFVNI